MSTKKVGGTSAPVASKAGKDLSNPKTPKVDRAPIASALAQKIGQREVARREPGLLPGLLNALSRHQPIRLCCTARRPDSSSSA